MKITPKSIRIACWNMRGFASSIPYLRSLCIKADIIAISEHWLHENRLKQLEEVSNKFLYCARASKFALADNYGTKRGQGGMAILWSKSIGGVSQISDIIHDRLCGIRLQTASYLVLNIVSMYLPAQGSPESLEAVLDDLSDFIETRELGSMTIVCGDANCDMGNLGGEKGVKPPNNRGKKFHDLIESHNPEATNLKLWAKGPVETYIGPTGSSTIDYILTPREMLSSINECIVLSEDVLNCSDHNAVLIDLEIGRLLPTTVDITPPRVIRWSKLTTEDVRNLYTNRVNKDMEDILTSLCYVSSPKSLDLAIEKLIYVLNNAGKSLPISKYRPNLKPYWNDELDNLKKIKVCKYNTWVSEGRPRNASSQSWCENKQARKDFTRALKRVGKEYENSQMIEAIDSNTVDRAAFWRFLKKCRKPSGSKILAMKDKHDKMVYEVSEILKVWKTHFAALSTPYDDPSYDQGHFDNVNKRVCEFNKSDSGSVFLETPFDLDEVQKAINKLKINKASGYDSICAEHIKYGRHGKLSSCAENSLLKKSIQIPIKTHF